ncbi:hypothetical protein AX14_002707 [Amanita brunnescens Koide BX004]|nr:hypothetical protein AX14_002707 [Amanita brunnescens Koide BX004]
MKVSTNIRISTIVALNQTTLSCRRLPVRRCEATRDYNGVAPSKAVHNTRGYLGCRRTFLAIRICWDWRYPRISLHNGSFLSGDLSNLQNLDNQG